MFAAESAYQQHSVKSSWRTKWTERIGAHDGRDLEPLLPLHRGSLRVNLFGPSRINKATGMKVTVALAQVVVSDDVRAAHDDHHALCCAASTPRCGIKSFLGANKTTIMAQ